MNEYNEAAEYNSNQLAQQIEQTIPDARIKNLGWLIVVILPNKSTFTLNVLSADQVDLAGEDCQNRHWDATGISWQQALDSLAQVNGLTEQTSTGAVAGYSTPGAFARDGQKSNRAVQQSEREGWKILSKEASTPATGSSPSWWTGKYPIGSPSASLAEAKKQRDQSGRKKVSPLGYTEDPLGADRAETKPNKHSEFRKASPIRHNWEGGSPLALTEESGSNDASGSISENQTSQTLAYLADMLPADGAELDGNKLVVTVGGATILIGAMPNGNFAIQSQVDGETVQENDNIPAGDLIKWAFAICDQIGNLAASWENKEKFHSSPHTDNIPPSDVYEVIRELAADAGHSTDILRNKSLFDLRQGLVSARPPFAQRSGRRFFGDDFNAGHTADNEVSASVKGRTMHEGHPVSINENRDVSRPYQNTMGKKKLIYTKDAGAVFVDVDQVPPQKKLSWDAEHGVILTDENAPSPDRRNMWKHHWQP